MTITGCRPVRPLEQLTYSNYRYILLVSLQELTRKEVAVIVGGRDFEFSRSEIELRMRGVEPESIQKHAVEVNGLDYPPKQVLAVMTGWSRTSYTTMEAQRVLRRLGFQCREFDAAKARYVTVPPMGPDDNEDGDFSAETMEAVSDLLALGKEHGVGITFTPDSEGWTVGYMHGMGGGDLVTTYDLQSAAKASLRPLRDFVRDGDRARAERE